MTLNDHESPTASATKLTVWTRGPITTGGCLAGDAVLMHAGSGWPMQLRDLVRRRDGLVLTMRDASVLTSQPPAAYLSYRPAQLYRLTTYTGRSIDATAEQPFLTREGWRPLSALCPSDAVAVVAEYPQLFGRGDTDVHLVKLLAYLTANGTVGDGTAPPIVDPDVRADFEAAVQAKGDEWDELEGASLCANVTETAPQVEITVEGEQEFSHDAEHVQEERDLFLARGDRVCGSGGRAVGGSGESHLPGAPEAPSLHS